MNALSTEILRPSVLVVLRTRIEGAVRYQRTDIEADHAEGKKRVAKWETTRVIENPEEHAEAIVTRGKVISLIRSTCSVTSAFGLVAPLDRREKLEERLREAREVVAAFNRKARTCSVSFAAIRGEIATTDAEAARAIIGEVGRQVAAMRAAIAAVKPEEIRKAATEAKALAAVLSDQKRDEVGEAVKAARDAAREITRRVVKSGEKAATVLREIDTTALVAASRTFIDLDSATPPESAPLVAAVLDLR